MRLISLSLENFRQHRSMEIQFPLGLVGILGENGSGKTTILEAIAWALYGKGTRGSNESLIWRMAAGKSTAMAMLTFAFGGQTLTVKRSQSTTKNTAELIQNSKVVANSTKAVNEKILELLAMTHEEFFNSYFTGQKDLNFLAAKGATERERFIAKMLGYEKITEVQGNTTKQGTIRFDLRLQEKQVDRLEGGLGNEEQIKDNIRNYQTQLATAQEVLRAATVEIERAIAQKNSLNPEPLSQKRDRHHQLTSQSQNYQSQLERLIKDLSSKTAQRSLLTSSLQEYQSLELELTGYESMVRELPTLEIAKQEFNRRCELEKRYSVLNQELQLLELEISKDIDISQIRSAIANSQLQLEIINSEVQSQTQLWQTSQAEIRSNIKAANQDLEKLLSQHQVILDAGVDGVCPTCERTLCQEYDHVVDGFLAQISEMRSQIVDYEQQLLTLTSIPEALKLSQQKYNEITILLKQQQQEELKQSAELARLELFQSQLKAKTAEAQQLQSQILLLPSHFDQERYNHLVTQIQILKPKYEQYLRQGGANQRLEEIDREIANLDREQKQLENQISELGIEITDLNFQESEYLELKSAIATLTDHIETLRQQHSQAQQQQALIAQAMSTAQQQEADFYSQQTECLAAKKAQALLQEIDNAFTQMRQHFTDEIRPQLADTASIFLNQLTDGRYNTIEIDPKYNVIVLADGDRKPVISGGEEDIVNLCLRLAISQMITERSGQSFSLLILDEVFGSLDDSRINNVLTLLHGLEQQFEQVLIISHLDSIKDHLNHTIRLEFNAKEQCSQLAQSLIV